MKKRVISMLLSILMLISMVSAFPFAVNAAPNITFVYSPSLLIGGETEYNIVWKTNAPSIGYVTYTYGGKTYTVYDERNGVIVSDDNIHSVKVPIAHLDAAGKYTATSAAVESRSGYNIKLGSPSSKDGKVKGIAKTDGIKIGCFSDIHMYDTWGQSTLERSMYSLKNYMKGVDLVMLPGDVASIMTTEKYLDLLFMAFESFSADGTPVLYIPGNHECRGIIAQRLPTYFGFTETSDLYGRVVLGPMEILITFCGEDKIDGHQEYGDLNAMEHYKNEQYEWFYACGGFTNNKKYNISTSHSHNLVDVYMTDEFMSKIAEYDPDIHINGHTHAQKIDRPSNYTFPFLHDGAHENNATMRTTLVTLENGVYKITGFNDAGTVTINDSATKAKRFKGASAAEQIVAQPENAPEVQETVKEEIKPVIKGETVVEPSKESVPTQAGVATSTLKGAGNTTAITVKPTVFDGGAYYNVVWQTTPDVRATGEVIVVSGDVKNRYRSQIVGKITTGSTHSVRIPKGTMGNCKYEAKARVVVEYTYGGYVTTPPTSYGAYVSAGQVSFKGDVNAKQNKFTFVAVAGTKTQGNAAKVKSEIGNKTPDMLITLGNMVDAFNTEKDFGTYLNITQTITGGKYPVMFIRGENETKGAFAAHISKYIRNFTSEAVQGGLFLNTNYDVVSLTGLDTATAQPDATYNKYAVFDPERQRQAKWLTETLGAGNQGTYNIVFANADNLRDCGGTDFTPGLGNIGANLTVTAQSGKASFSMGLDTYSKATCGSPSGDGTYGLRITCENEAIAVAVLGGDEIGEVDVKSSVANPEGESNNNNNQNNNNNNNNSNNNSSNNNSSNSNSSSNNSSSNNSSSNNSSSNNSSSNNQWSEGGTEFIKGEHDGVDGNFFVREVDEDWYLDYQSLSIPATDSAPKSNGKTTELEFINMVANLVSVDLYPYSGSTNADKAASWASDSGVYNGYLGENPVSDSIMSQVIDSIFPVAE